MQYYIKIDPVYSNIKRTLPLHECQRTTRFFLYPKTKPIKKIKKKTLTTYFENSRSSLELSITDLQIVPKTLLA